MRNVQNGPEVLSALAHADAAEMVRACRAYAALPDIRRDKVDEMRKRIASGSYRPSGGELADAILGSASRALLCRS